MSHGNGHENDSHGMKGATFFTGLCTGAVIGTGLTLLFAPRAGSELRGQTASAAASIGKVVSETVDGVTARGREAYDGARDVVARAGNRIDRLVASATKNLGKDVIGGRARDPVIDR